MEESQRKSRQITIQRCCKCLPKLENLHITHGNGNDTGNGNEDVNIKANAATTLWLVTCESKKTMRDLLDWKFTTGHAFDVKVLNICENIHWHGFGSRMEAIATFLDDIIQAK
jgi:hypothetical protein